MRFFVDGCVPPSLVRHLNDLGSDAGRPRDLGWLGRSDRAILARAGAQDRIIVTENAADIRELAAGMDIHPGLILLPSVASDEARRLMDLVVSERLAGGGSRPGDLLADAVLTIDEAGRIDVKPLP